MEDEASADDPWYQSDLGPRSGVIERQQEGGPPAQSAPERLPEGAFLNEADYFGQLRRHHVEYLNERNKQRRSMMSWTLGLASGIVGVSTLAMTAYFISEWGRLEPAVMLGWFGSVVAEVLGLVYIVASYLFPTDDHAVENMIKDARKVPWSGGV